MTEYSNVDEFVAYCREKASQKAKTWGKQITASIEDKLEKKITQNKAEKKFLSENVVLKIIEQFGIREALKDEGIYDEYYRFLRVRLHKDVSRSRRKIPQYVISDETKEQLINDIKKAIASQDLDFAVKRSRFRNINVKNYLKVRDDIYAVFFMEKYFVNYILNDIYGESSLDEYIAHEIILQSPMLSAVYVRMPWQTLDYIKSRNSTQKITEATLTHIRRSINKTIFYELLEQNPYYSNIANIAIQKHKLLLDAIPDNYIDMYPLARSIHRKFILHIGETNSGKTYEAINALKSSSTGVYLAPLRLLAYEIYEKLNMDEIPCNMVTGEETLEIPFAEHTSSTIEMANLNRHYEVAVIDEAQMISDEQRGGAWTAAVLGIAADTVHVCCAPSAKNILISLIKECGDTYEVKTHRRSVPLTFEDDYFSFPESVLPQDALIVFSKASVLQCAAVLQESGFKTSVIYGALPYDARRREVDKFISGETDVVVATDAIGMGLNLPVRRIVFLETVKYDGKTDRYLLPEEIKQIAGRAGRQGMYNVGYYTARRDKNIIHDGMLKNYSDIHFVRVKFPESLLQVDLPLSDILEKWEALPNNGIYVKENLSSMLSLVNYLEACSDGKADKYTIYKFATIPFDEKKSELFNIWTFLFNVETGNEKKPENFKDYYFKGIGIKDKSIDYLEIEYKKCDLLYSYLYKFHHNDELADIMSLKNKLSEKITANLAQQNLTHKKCRICGRVIPWNLKSSICDMCYFSRSGRGKRRNRHK